MLSNSPAGFKYGIYAGLLGTLGDAIIHLISFLLIGTSMTAHYISQLMFPHKEVILIRFVYGLSTHFFAGALVGIFLYLLLKISGKEYAILKGLGLGIFFWIIHVIVIPNIVEPRPYLFRTEIEAFVDLIAHLAYGAIGAFYLVNKFDTMSDNT